MAFVTQLDRLIGRVLLVPAPSWNCPGLAP